MWLQKLRSHYTDAVPVSSVENKAHLVQHVTSRCMTMGRRMVGVAWGKRLIKQIIRSQRLTKISGERSYTGKIV